MSETATGEQNAKQPPDTKAGIVYVVSLVVWVVACILFGTLFSEHLFTTPWLVVPFVMGFAWIVYVGYRAWRDPLELGLGEEDERKKEEKERSLFEWIVSYTSNVILATSIVMLVAVYTEYRINVPDPDLVATFIYGFSALGVAALLILPFPWLKDPVETRVLRHVKTGAHLFVVSLFLCSIIALAVGIYRALSVG